MPTQNEDNHKFFLFFKLLFYLSRSLWIPLPQSPWTTFRSDSNSQSCNILQKMRKNEYSKECMVWKSGKKGIFGKVTLYEKPCIFLFNFQYLRKGYVTKVVGNVSSYCSDFFLFWWKVDVKFFWAKQPFLKIHIFFCWINNSLGLLMFHVEMAHLLNDSIYVYLDCKVWKRP